MRWIPKRLPRLCALASPPTRPLKYWGVSPGQSVAVVGIGGLGYMAVQLAWALGTTVTAITRDKDKREAAEQLGAHEVLIASDSAATKAHVSQYNFILITIPDAFDINDCVLLAKRNSSLTTVGLPGPYKAPLNNMHLAMHRISVAGSSIAETQEVLDFCAEHTILPEAQIINMLDIIKAYDGMMDEEIPFRYVIDMALLKDAE